MPGHTAPQTSVLVPEEGVVFTGDNVFHKCRSWLQECDPWEWLAALKSIEALDVETIVPGHGEPCSKAYLREQGQIVENWVGYVERFVDRGVGPEEILKGPVEVDRSRTPIRSASACSCINERLTDMIVRNLHQRIPGQKAATLREELDALAGALEPAADGPPRSTTRRRSLCAFSGEVEAMRFITLFHAATKSRTNSPARPSTHRLPPTRGAGSGTRRPGRRGCRSTSARPWHGRGPRTRPRLRDGLPLRAHIEQVDEEVVGQRLGALCGDAVRRLPEVRVQHAQAADENRQLGRSRSQQLGPVEQQLLWRGVTALR